jgi:uncharacterized repeat protein (TIGR01451 family)
MRTLIGVLLAGLWLHAFAQQSAQVDYFAASGSFEIDHNRDGREDMVSHFFEGGVQASHIVTSLDFQNKYGGSASQRLRIARDGGSAGRYVIQEAVDFNALIKPAVGEPILVQIALRAEAFQNASYEVYVITGSRRVQMLPAISEPTPSWRVLSAVVPVEADTNGNPQFTLRVQLNVNAGAATGTLWIDEARALSSRTLLRSPRLPNQLQLCLPLERNSDGTVYLTQFPIKLFIGAAQQSRLVKRHFPDVVDAPYVYFPATVISPASRHNSDLYNYDDIVQNHPDWLLRDSTGQLISLGNNYYVDLGRPDVRARALQSLRDFIPRAGYPQFVYLDNFNMLLAAQYQIPQYPDRDSWVQAVVGWCEQVAPAIQREFGTRFIPNAAWAPGFWLRGIAGHPDAPGASIASYFGGFLIEHAFMRAQQDGRYSMKNYGTATGNNSPAVWYRRLVRDTIRLTTEHPDKIIVLMHTVWTNNLDPNSPDYSPRRIRYAIAGSLILQHENTYIYLNPAYEPAQYPSGFYPPELFVPLGRWTENYRILNGDLISGGLFVRNYENGIVVWNPRGDVDYTFTVPRDLYDWDRNLIRAGTVVNIPRQTGHVFYSAPEIHLEITPVEAQVQPGQTVQLTVRYQNRGTAPGTNVRIAVPLPAGMNLVGSNPQARLENGEVAWTVPNIPVGGSGTLQFTVRVE